MRQATLQSLLVKTGKRTSIGVPNWNGVGLRPQLAVALEEARRRHCAVIVAKLDRLSRDVAFISSLMAQKARFIVAELGADADPLVIHILAAMCERERLAISTRTKEALAQAKERALAVPSSTKPA